MEALRTPAARSRRPAHGQSDVYLIDAASDPLGQRLHSALAVLVEAHDYARDLHASDWDFAVEIETLRQLRLTNGELRWLLAHGLIEHALEIPRTREGTRDFVDAGSANFGRRSCFVLSAAGIELAAELGDEARDEHDGEPSKVPEDAPRETAPPPLLRKPRWDRNRRELRVGSMLVKRFTVPALDQESVLVAFDEQGWESRIDNPLPCQDEVSRKVRLLDTIRLLNQSHKRTLLRFRADTGASSIWWEFHRDAADPAAEAAREEATGDA